MRRKGCPTKTRIRDGARQLASALGYEPIWAGENLRDALTHGLRDAKHNEFVERNLAARRRRVPVSGSSREQYATAATKHLKLADEHKNARAQFEQWLPCVRR